MANTQLHDAMKQCARCQGNGQIRSGQVRGLQSSTGGVSSSADWEEEGDWQPVWAECDDCGGVGFLEDDKPRKPKEAK
jgi:DnaJ-class molecular chaperone